MKIQPIDRKISEPHISHTKRFQAQKKRFSLLAKPLNLFEKIGRGEKI